MSIHHKQLPCSIPGSRDTLTIPGQNWDKHTPHTTPLSEYPGVKISRDLLTILGQYQDEHTPYITPIPDHTGIVVYREAMCILYIRWMSES